jgi:hypothetical protein
MTSTASPAGRTTGFCPLCGKDDQALTTEHIIPRWMLRDFSAEWSLSLTQRPTSLAVFSQVTVPVCDECNRWMNDTFEQPAMPILRDLIAGRERVLTRRNQRQLAQWFTKTFLMLDLINDPVMPRRHPGYIEFREKGGLIPGSYLWIGRIGQEVVRPAWASENSNPPSTHELLPRRSFSRGISIGSVFVKFACVSVNHRPALFDHPWLTTFLQLIHPAATAIQWPPTWVMNDEILAIMHDIMRPAPQGRRATQSWYGVTMRSSPEEVRSFIEKAAGVEDQEA